MKIILIGLIMIFSSINVYAEQTIEQSHQDYYTQVCERFIACGDHPGIAEMASYARIKDVDSCIATLTKRDSLEGWKSLLSEKLISFSPKEQSACFAKISTLSCNTIAKGIRKPSAIKGCEAYVNGTIGLGEKCFTSMECKSAGTVCGGTCMEPPLLECGNERCTADQACDVKAQKCISPRKTGQACSNFSECESSSCVDGVCGVGAIVSKPGGSCLASFICPLGEECQEGVCKPF